MNLKNVKIVKQKSPPATNNTNQRPQPRRKTQQEQQKQQPTPQSRQNSDKALDAAVTYYRNTQEPTGSCIFPMGFDTAVNPGFAKSTIELNTTGRYGMVIMSPEFKDALEVVTQDDDVQEVVSNEASTKLSYSNKFYPSPITFDDTLEAVSGKTIKSSLAPEGGFLYYSNTKDTFLPGLKYYSGAWKVGGVMFTVTCSKTTTIRVEIGSYDGSGYNVVADKDLTLNAGIATSYEFNLGGANVNNLVLLIRPPSVGASTVTALVTFDENNASSRVGGVTAKKYDWFDLPGMKCLEQEYELANQYLVFAESWLLTNNTRLLDKGGILAVCQLPEGSRHELPAAPSEALRYIGTLQKQALSGLPLAEGAHITYVPQDLDDVLLQDKISGASAKRVSTKPIMVIAWDKGADSEDVSLSLSLTGRKCWQYVTNSIVTASYSAYGNEALIRHMFKHTMVESMGSNPHHMARIARNVKRFVNDPRTRAIASATWSAAKLIAPAVLALL